MKIDNKVDKHLVKEGLIDVVPTVPEDASFTKDLTVKFKRTLKADRVVVRYEKGYYYGEAYGVDTSKNKVSRWGNSLAKLAEKNAFGKEWQVAETNVSTERLRKTDEWDVKFHVGVAFDD